METCKTCKHWNTEGQTKTSAPCTRIGQYGLFTVQESEFCEDPDTAVIQGQGQLWTKPEFSCAMHERL